MRHHRACCSPDLGSTAVSKLTKAAQGAIDGSARLVAVPRRLKVASSRNSLCHSAKLSTLDLSKWFTDTSFDQHYLHVFSKSGDGTVHRVWCRHAEQPRLEFDHGTLWWLVTRYSAHAK